MNALTPGELCYWWRFLFNRHPEDLKHNPDGTVAWPTVKVPK